jgi:phosphoribosylamine--glycine ligase
MIVGIIGSGGREHAICTKIKESSKISKIFCIPGNAGTNHIAENIDIKIGDFKSIKNFCLNNNIELLIVGPEQPLVDGIVDYFLDTNIKVFGPNKLASKLEGSKIFTKELCEKYNIPTANFKIIESLKNAEATLKSFKYPLVIKADGLAAGKGVYICNNYNEGYIAAKEIFNGKFGKAKNLLIEEFLDGEEMSYFVISDGKSYQFIGSAQDHKRVGEGDKGKNTGGMGCYSPSRLFNSKLAEKINNNIIIPTLNAIKDMGSEYIGFLYVGLMIKNEKPYLIEFNVRMGDPECQTILPLLENDLSEIFFDCCAGKLSEKKIKLSNKKSICIVLCSKGYPEDYKKDSEISKLNKLSLKDNEYIYHAGTKLKDNKILNSGGRVLNFVSTSNNLKESRNDLIKLIKKLDWENGFFRKDIAYKVID